MSDLPGESGDQQPASRDDAAIQADLYCLECGYNLRGLSGDPVRCPECGNFNPVALIEVPAEAIRRQLRRMESAPTYSVVGMLLTALTAIPVAFLISGEPLSLACPLIPLFIGLLLWIGGVARLRGSCLGKPGWLAALLRFQAVALLSIAGIGAIFGGGIGLETAISGPSFQLGTLLAVMLMSAVVVLLVVIWGFPQLHHWLKAPMERLQREVAVEIARERLRKKMHREKRWMTPR